jgi:hypothetical protein
MSEEVINSMINVIIEIIVLKQKKRTVKNKREWVRKWIQRRDKFGVSSTLINEHIFLVVDSVVVVVSTIAVAVTLSTI